MILFKIFKHHTIFFLSGYLVEIHAFFNVFHAVRHSASQKKEKFPAQMISKWSKFINIPITDFTRNLYQGCSKCKVCYFWEHTINAQKITKKFIYNLLDNVTFLHNFCKA